MISGVIENNRPYVVVTIAGSTSVGGSVDMQCSVAIVALESGAVNPANVLVSNGEILIGVGLLKKFGYILTIDFPNNQLELKKSI